MLPGCGCYTSTLHEAATDEYGPVVSGRIRDKFLQNPAQAPLSPPRISHKFTQNEVGPSFRSNITAPNRRLYGITYLVIKLSKMFYFCNVILQHPVALAYLL